MSKTELSLTVALAGQPNVGKSTGFNMLTGLNQHVGNWPGKTVEKKTGRYTHGRQVIRSLLNRKSPRVTGVCTGRLTGWWQMASCYWNSKAGCNLDRVLTPNGVDILCTGVNDDDS